jgi:hypothetical protein
MATAKHCVSSVGLVVVVEEEQEEEGTILWLVSRTTLSATRSIKISSPTSALGLNNLMGIGSYWS